MSSLQFPLLGKLNEFRAHLRAAGHLKLSADPSQKISTVTEQTLFWMGHKAISLICLPANLAAIAVGMTGMTISACTLGAIKVFIFAVSLGNIEPKFSTGFLWFGERTIFAGVEVLNNIYELGFDAGLLIWKGVEGIKWVADKLHLTGLVNTILKQIASAFSAVANRIARGFILAYGSEGEFSFDTPPLINIVNAKTSYYRIGGTADATNKDRCISSIFAHYIYSIPNITLNTVAAACTGVASVVLFTAFLGKAVVNTVADIDLRIPTFAPHIIAATLRMNANVAIDLASNFGDIFVLTYKASNAIGLTQAVVTVLNVIAFIPKAIFS